MNGLLKKIEGGFWESYEQAGPLNSMFRRSRLAAVAVTSSISIAEEESQKEVGQLPVGNDIRRVSAQGDFDLESAATEYRPLFIHESPLEPFSSHQRESKYVESPWLSTFAGKQLTIRKEPLDIAAATGLFSLHELLHVAQSDDEAVDLLAKVLEDLLSERPPLTFKSSEQLKRTQQRIARAIRRQSALDKG
jgi:hypothetical protein